MSSITELEKEFIIDCVITSANVLFLYESIITFCEEVDVIWRRKLSTMTWIYAYARYSTVATIILSFTSPGNIKSCEANVYTQDILVLISFLCFGLFSGLRVYALCDGRYIMAGLVFLLNMVPFAANIFNFATTRIIMKSEVCRSITSESTNLNLCLTLLSRISVITGDILVLMVTWKKTAQSYSEARRLKMEAPLTAMLIRDGTLYFVVLLVINMLQVFGDDIPTLFALGVASPFFQNLSPLIVCRFILNLRHVKPAGSSWVSGNQSHSLRFVGNMGESLRFDEPDEEPEECELEGNGSYGNEPIDGPDLPEPATAASDLGQVNKCRAGGHLNFDVQEVLQRNDV